MRRTEYGREVERRARALAQRDGKAPRSAREARKMLEAEEATERELALEAGAAHLLAHCEARRRELAQRRGMG